MTMEIALALSIVLNLALAAWILGARHGKQVADPINRLVRSMEVGAARMEGQADGMDLAYRMTGGHGEGFLEEGHEDSTSRYRCPSLNPWDPEDRCKLHMGHDEEHEGYIKERPVIWDHSPAEVSIESHDYWVKVDDEV